MAQPSKEPCKKEACDIQACLSKNNFLPQRPNARISGSDTTRPNARSERSEHRRHPPVLYIVRARPFAREPQINLTFPKCGCDQIHVDVDKDSPRKLY
ncbi:hypothetical protein V6N11_033115 [Hibiscus sabdariffa]|uniref:Uncharacterized protein n=1 Tax=Hibiscus sabdariffa TaxID=183260 RepID=A0ABR2A1T8_9ROSI